MTDRAIRLNRDKENAFARCHRKLAIQTHSGAGATVLGLLEPLRCDLLYREQWHRTNSSLGCQNAPTLESKLRKRFSKQRLNKVRKEFFRLIIGEIQHAVTELHGTVEYAAEPEALQYNESISMTEADFDFVQDAIGEPIEELDD